MPSAEQIRQFLVGVVLPPIAGVIATWIVSTVHILNLFGVTSASLAGELVNLGTFGIVTLIGFLTSHHILSGHYTPAAKAAAGHRKLP